VRRTTEPAAWADTTASLNPFGVSGTAGDALFFDTETTGLSGGAGSLAFLIGLGWVENGSVVVEQYFLSDYPGEREFLTGFLPLLQSRGLWISYNGKSFDSHILRSRAAMNRIPLEVPNQLDLLHVVRRFWRRQLPDCSLSTVEGQVLGRRRSTDIPGWQVPDAYFEFIRRGERGALDLVFEHNRSDVVALADILGCILGFLEGGPPPANVDLTALGEFLVMRDPGRARTILASSFEAGDSRAGRLLSLRYKRERAWRQAVEIWQRMAERGSGFAAIELAKYWEHVRRCPDEALACLEQVWRGLPVPERYRADVRRRRARLRSKLERTGD
jgi:uncharacterized protein YprB with RNaseH-like and TPR domain